MNVVKFEPSSPKLKALYKKYRFKFYRGGRGSAKSWGIGEALVHNSNTYNLRILCCREIQKSIKESSMKLIVDTINRLGLQDNFEVLKTEIRNRVTGSIFIFEGLKSNISKIKSIEGIDICWIEEADSTSEESLRVLIPSIRKEGSEIWVSYNPQLPTDPIDKMSRDNKDSDTIVVEMNYYDNKYFPEVLKKEMERCKANDPENFNHIWLGDYRQQGDDLLYSYRDIKESQSRKPVINSKASIILAADIAEMGDDATCVYIRQGNVILHKEKIYKQDTVDVYDAIHSLIIRFKVDYAVIDAIGVGLGVYDMLNKIKSNLDYEAIKFKGSYKASKDTFLNARAETYDLFNDWVKNKETLLEYDKELVEEMLQIHYIVKDDKKRIEPKEDIKKRLGRSPDSLDGITMTFYVKEDNQEVDTDELVRIALGGW